MYQGRIIMTATNTQLTLKEILIANNNHVKRIHSWRCLEHSCQCLSPRNIGMPFCK